MLQPLLKIFESDQQYGTTKRSAKAIACWNDKKIPRKQGGKDRKLALNPEEKRLMQ